MITCKFEDGNAAALRHVVVDAVAINEKGQVLLIKRGPASFTGIGKYALPGGYLDRDEGVVTGTLREFREETGYEGEVGQLFYINDTIDAAKRKDDRQNVGFIFLVSVTSGEPQLNDEVSEITWFDESNLPDEEQFAFDHRRIILKYFAYRKQQFALPLFATAL